MSRTSKGLESSIWSNGKHILNKPKLPPPRSVSYSPRRRSSDRSGSHSRSPNRPPQFSQPQSDSTPAPASGATRLTPTQAFHRFEQACQRLRWKFIDLENSYRRATHPEEFNFSRADAETNFKVDFHEFYVWIEQAVVLLLLIYGVAVTRGSPSGIGASMYSRSKRFNAGHAYHHNVLKALEDEKCPVHGVLGKGQVIEALWKAKELRNRWKDAAQGKETPPLQMYDLVWIVGQILSGLEAAYDGVAAGMVEEERRGRDEKADGGMVELHVEDDMWEWMVEPMDWEAA